MMPTMEMLLDLFFGLIKKVITSTLHKFLDILISLKSSDYKDVKFSLKVTTNKQKTKVLFAEADNDFADVLVSFLALPLGTIVKVLKKHYGEGKGKSGCKEILLNPKSPFEDECRQLKLDINETQPAKCFTCKNPCCGRWDNKIECSSVYYDTVECRCGKMMAIEIVDKASRVGPNYDGGVYTINTTLIVISDDLQMFPTMTGFIQTLGNLGISDIDIGETIVVTFGFKEIMDLLKGSLFSRTPLSDIVLNKRRTLDSAKQKPEPGILVHRMEKQATSRNTKKMILKVLVQKSTNKLLFAQSQEDFVDFLCTLLAITLGGVEGLLGGKTCLNSIDNLYASIADPDLVKVHLEGYITKVQLANGYLSEYQFRLPLEERCGSIRPSFSYKASSVNFVGGKGKYVKGQRMYKITDDLNVTPFHMTSTISSLRGLKIPVSDVRELELEIGLEEALSILKASLTSTSALTDGLKINTMLMKQPKQER
ncbi:hypothetical protein ACP275_13G019000 [Erythranthe tilingii]